MVRKEQIQEIKRLSYVYDEDKKATVELYAAASNNEIVMTQKSIKTKSKDKVKGKTESKGKTKSAAKKNIDSKKKPQRRNPRRSNSSFILFKSLSNRFSHKCRE